MRNTVVASFIVLLLLLMTCASAQAQATAQISGIIQDQSGAVLPGAEITATQIETGVSRSTVSNETGSYVLSNLPLGPYKLNASLPGFRSFVQTGIVLQVNSNPAINVVLQVGQELVVVAGDHVLVRRRRQELAQEARKRAPALDHVPEELPAQAVDEDRVKHDVQAAEQAVVVEPEVRGRGHDLLALREISDAVNDVRNDGPELLEPRAEQMNLL